MTEPNTPSPDVLERFRAQIDLHRTGEAISGCRVAYADFSVADVETAIAAIERLSAELGRAKELISESRYHLRLDKWAEDYHNRVTVALAAFERSAAPTAVPE